VAAKTNNGMSKKEAVRRALQAMGKDAKPAQMQPYIKDNFGIEMSTEHISNAKSEVLREGKAKKKPAAKPQEPQPAKAAAKVSRVGNGVSLQDLQTVKDLVGRVGPETLRSLIELLAR
jgi:hypothetical protein